MIESQFDTTLLSLRDICIIPATVSSVSSRKECNPYTENNFLPLITAPMNTVIDNTNWEKFHKAGIVTVIPRTVDFKVRMNLFVKTFVAFSLEEFSKLFYEEPSAEEYLNILTENNLQGKVCIDIANGHMQSLLEKCAIVKQKFQDRLLIMTGNIANPTTYISYALARIDYIRVGIGTGSQCTTSANVGVHFPMASLLQYINNIRNQANLPSYPKIIADGGFSNFDDIIKAYALGADYVMLGKLFAQCEEACGPVTMKSSGKDVVQHRLYYGMSTKTAQTHMGKTELRTSEGISSTIPITTTLVQFLNNFKDYLTSAMSYCNCRTLEEFQNNVCTMPISPLARMQYFK